MLALLCCLLDCCCAGPDPLHWTHSLTHSLTHLFTLNVHVQQIRFFLLQNKQGKTRLTKWYLQAPADSERVKMELDIHRIVVDRDRKFTNFVEVSYLTHVLQYD